MSVSPGTTANAGPEGAGAPSAVNLHACSRADWLSSRLAAPSTNFTLPPKRNQTGKNGRAWAAGEQTLLV